MKAFALLLGARGFGSARLSIADLPVRKWFRVLNERRRLATLDPRLLRDIGVSDSEAAIEATRPFWDVNRRH